MKLVGYSRVSTSKQVEGTSLTTQKESIETYCKLHGHELVHLFTDEGISGKNTKDRPQYLNMQRRLVDDRQVQGIIVSSLSRLGRSLDDVMGMVRRLEEEDRVFISIKENFDMTTKEGRMMLGMMAVVNQYERELIEERTTEGRAWAEEHGSKSGKPCHRPQKNIDWAFVEKMRNEKPPMSWGAISRALSFNPAQKITKQGLIQRARERGMKID
jgi:site-specific DNA recombinase